MTARDRRADISRKAHPLPALSLEPPRSEALKAHGAMFVFAAAISWSFTLGGLAAKHVDPSALTAMRFALAGLIMGVVASRVMRREHWVMPWRYLVLGGLLAGYFILMFEALRLTDPVSTGAIFTLTPLMSAGFGWLLLRQITPRIVMGSHLLAGLGALWVIFRADLARMLAFDLGPGEWIYLVACAGHAFYTPLVRRLHRGEPVAVFTFGTILGGLVITLIYGGRALIATDWTALPPIVWATALYLAVFATAMTFFLLQFATLRLPSAKVMAYGYLVPSFVILWEGLLGHGWIAGPVFLGVALTIAALLVLVRPDRVSAA